MIGRASCAVGLALALLLSSCNLPGTPAPSASTSPANTSRVAHLQLSEAEDAQTLDPALINDPTSLAIGAELFEGLTRLDATLRPVPALAQSWEIAEAGRLYTFHLRAAKYQSGATVQAQDAVTAWKRALAPETSSPLTTFFAPLGARYPGDSISGVQAVDQKTLVVRLGQPDSSLLTRLALPPYWLDDPGLNGAVTSGSGPYHLERWDRGHGLQLSAFSDYWGPRPQIRKVDIEIEPDNIKRLDRFTSGGVDIAHGFTGPQLLAFARDPKQAAELHKVPTTRTTWLGFNTVVGSGYGPPDRLAIAQAIDRSRVTDLAL
ncbi:MAG TPA: ABC transporter substrate-binding protein, partial [Steroidobacteraceae bacterium]|nr:ABC transporter substrate-binding protein [Steroidobacteraceae bacterium]